MNAFILTDNLLILSQLSSHFWRRLSPPLSTRKLLLSPARKKTPHCVWGLSYANGFGCQALKSTVTQCQRTNKAIIKKPTFMKLKTCRLKWDSDKSSYKPLSRLKRCGFHADSTKPCFSGYMNKRTPKTLVHYLRLGKYLKCYFMGNPIKPATRKTPFSYCQLYQLKKLSLQWLVRVK